MNADEKYLFDLNGYIVIENVLTADDVKLANQAIDCHMDQGKIADKGWTGDSPALQGTQGRGHLGDMLDWDEPYCNPFRHMLAHPTLVPYLNEILGKGFRMDHKMRLLYMDTGTEGLTFHGSGGPGFDPNQYYIFKDGKMHNGLSVVTIQLTDVNPGDGGLCVIPGSHKSNYACPWDMCLYQKYQEHVRHITCKAGDVVIFTEALTHGTIPWKANHQRRSILTRYTAGNMAYVPAPNVPTWANERQRAVMEPPYHTRLDRPMLEE